MGVQGSGELQNENEGLDLEGVFDSVLLTLYLFFFFSPRHPGGRRGGLSFDLG
jgi:hypothetical protein